MIASGKRLIALGGALGVCLWVILVALLMPGAESFQWDWRHSEAIPSKQSLLHAKVSSAERNAIAKAIAIQLEPDLGGLGGQTEQELEDNAIDTPVKIVDLNGDGTPEIIAQGSLEQGCRSTGNCPFWVFQKSGQEYKPLVHQAAVQSFNIEKSRSNGFSDVVVKTHGSATGDTVRLLQYREGMYRETGCYNAIWSMREGNTVHELKEPRLTPCGEK